MYIKSYRSGNGDNLELRYAKSISCSEVLLNLGDLSKEYSNLKDTDKQEFDAYSFNAFVTSKLREAVRAICANKFESMYKFSDSTYSDKASTLFNIIKYIDENDETCFFVPCSTTYLIDNKGATLATLHRSSGNN